LLVVVTAVFDNRATPPAGWNAWFAFDRDVTEDGVLRNAEALVRTGLRDAGYRFVNLDDLWQGPRDPETHVITSNNKTFPTGIAKLSATIHAMNLSFGLYTDRGAKTCAGAVGSQHHEGIDAATYAEWGVDYVKEDSCGASHEHEEAFVEYSNMQKAINDTARPIFFSLCGWMRYYAASSRRGVGQSWRVGTDCDSWDDFMLNADAAAATASFAGRGKFTDIDEIGRAACVKEGDVKVCSRDKRVTQFNLIAVVGSPLLLSDDMSNWTVPWSLPGDDLVKLYSNPEVLAVHQALDSDDEITYSRLAGGPVTQGGVMPMTTAHCSDDSKNLLWSTIENRIYTEAPGMEGWCLRQGTMSNPKPSSDACDHAEYVWVSACNTSCCGKNCEEYIWDAVNGTLKSRMATVSDVPGDTLTVEPEGVPNTVMVEEEFSPGDTRANSQQVSLDAKSGKLLIGDTGRCLSTAPPASTSVFGRKLTSGWALLFINWGTADADVTCDVTCMKKLGLGRQLLAVRDLWAHTSNGTVHSGSPFSVSVTSGGASVLVSLTPT